MSVLRSRRFRRDTVEAAEFERSASSVVPTGRQGDYALTLDLSVIQDLTKKLGVQDGVRDFSLSLADGRALPDWIDVRGHMLGVRSRSVSHITLRMDLVYLGGQVGRFDVVIDAVSSPVKLRVKAVGETTQAQLFSAQLLDDDEPETPFPAAA